MQLLVGASRSNHLGSVKYIIDHAKNLDINVRESDKVTNEYCSIGINFDLLFEYLYACRTLGQR